MITFVLMAGQSKRFAAAGYATPKPALPMPDGRLLIEWALDGLQAVPGQVITVGQRDHLPMLGWALRSHPRAPKGVWLDQATTGPLDTLWHVHKWLKSPEPVLVLYVDVLVDPSLPQRLAHGAHGRNAPSGAVIFESVADRYGYWDGAHVQPARADLRWALSGLFYFQSGPYLARQMRSRLGPEHGLVHCLTSDSYMLRASTGETTVELPNGGIVPAGPARELWDLGTPADYETYFAEQRDWLAYQAKGEKA